MFTGLNPATLLPRTKKRLVCVTLNGVIDIPGVFAVLYLRGNILSLAGNFNTASTGYLKFDAGQITIKKANADSQSTSFYGVVATNTINLTGYNYINFEYVITSISGGTVQFDIGIVSSATQTTPKAFVNNWYTVSSRGGGGGTVSYNITHINVLSYVHCGFQMTYGLTFMGAIYRIWLS